MSLPHAELRERVLQANRRIAAEKLAALTWGNASEADREQGVLAIKPSGVAYEDMTAEDIVIVRLDDGELMESRLRPSSDLDTHRLLYQAFPVSGIVHSHAPASCAWAQACRAIPCLGTTHADTFYGPVPVTRMLTNQEIEESYEYHTGTVIVECFSREAIHPDEVPGVLVAGHGPFSWGSSADEAVTHAVILEQVAAMARDTVLVNPEACPLPKALLDKHFLRKHGRNAYYGQS